MGQGKTTDVLANILLGYVRKLKMNQKVSVKIANHSANRQTCDVVIDVNPNNITFIIQEDMITECGESRENTRYLAKLLIMSLIKSDCSSGELDIDTDDMMLNRLTYLIA